MESTHERPIGEAFLAIATLVYEGDSYESIYESICRAAVASIEGCDHASVMLRSGSRTWTAASSDAMGLAVDALEREIGEGPCLDAIEEEAAHLCADIAHGSPWPELSARLLAETPVRGMAGFRIVLEGRKVGALNVFSDTAGALDATVVDQCALLTAFTSVALAAIDRGEQANTLRSGLDSNREIGKAVGLLMAEHGIGDQEAFDLLATTSQQMNTKLAQVAERVVAIHHADHS